MLLFLKQNSKAEIRLAKLHARPFLQFLGGLLSIPVAARRVNADS
jgi:hypothetical protein